MYPHINHVIMTGRLTKDPESRYMQSGIIKATLGVAVNNRRKVNGEWQNATIFITVECWDKVAENICERGRKGLAIMFTGQAIQDKYEKDGKTVTFLKFNAQNIMVLAEQRDQAPRQEPTASPQPNDFDNDDDEKEWNDDVPF